VPFRYCPSCGESGPDFLDGKRWHCSRCGFEFFRNAATAAGAILHCDEGILLLERALDPGRGKLGLPGGFVDSGERAEDAVLRECLEEIGWAPPELRFLGTYPNVYSYGGVVYDTCDLYFYYRFPAGAALPALSPRDGEALAIRLVPLSSLGSADLAFPSLERALEAYAKACAETSSISGS
jgi:ADP-ribose pyrophosphatase YjhB (NUDIX family)